MVIVGWILIVLGILAYLAGLVIALMEQFKTLPPIYDIHKAAIDIAGLAKLVESLSKFLQQYAKLSVGIQWAILGLVSIVVGVYLIG
jgi:hypothetical protein